ncbi:unnamed protein product, partial [Vitis vinifera]
MKKKKKTEIQRPLLLTIESFDLLETLQYLPASAQIGFPFIDRDPDLFSILLSLLRTGNLPSKAKAVDLQDLFSEAKFYGIESLLVSSLSNPSQFDAFNLEKSLILPLNGRDSPSAISTTMFGSVHVAHGSKITSFDWSLQRKSTILTRFSAVDSLLALSPSVAAAGATDFSGLQILDLENGYVKETLNWENVTRSSSTVQAIGSSPKFLFTSFESGRRNSNSIVVFDIENLKPVSEIGTNEIYGADLDSGIPATKLSWISDYNLLMASGSHSGPSGVCGNIKLWDVRSGNLVWELKEKVDCFSDVTVSENLSAIFKVGVNSGEVFLMDLRNLGAMNTWVPTGETRRVVNGKKEGVGCKIGSHGNQVFCSKGGNLELWSEVFMGSTIKIAEMVLAPTEKVVLGSIAFAIFWVLAVFPAVPFLPIGRTAGSLLGAILMVIFRVITPDQAYAAIDLSILGLLFGTMVVSVYLEQADMFKYLGLSRIMSLPIPSYWPWPRTQILDLLQLQLVIPKTWSLPSRDEEHALDEVISEEDAASHRFSPAAMSHPTASNSQELNPSNLQGTLNGGPLEENESSAKPWKRLLWKTCVYLVTIGMLIALLVGLNMSWTALTAALALVVLDFKDAQPCLQKVSYSILIFFCGMFITVDGFNRTGIPSTLWNLTEPYARINHVGGIVVLTLVILVLSNVASNVPTVLLLGARVAASATMTSQGQEKRAWLILAWVSTVAGNLSLLGSAANLIVCEQARRARFFGYTLSFWSHLKFGVPSTLIVTAIGLLLIRG